MNKKRLGCIRVIIEVIGLIADAMTLIELSPKIFGINKPDSIFQQWLFQDSQILNPEDYCWYIGIVLLLGQVAIASIIARLIFRHPQSDTRALFSFIGANFLVAMPVAIPYWRIFLGNSINELVVPWLVLIVFGVIFGLIIHLQSS